jgi:endonuclease/exonuclease/phosphatase family metal-dependent hydrolase
MMAAVLVRVLTYNIHKCIGGLDGKYLPQRVADVIAHYDPDVAFLQEVDHGVKRTGLHDQAELLAKMLGYRHRAHVPNVKVPGGGWYGNALLSKFPLERVSAIDLTLPPKKVRSALHARCRMRLGDHTRTVHLIGAHLGLAGIERKHQLKKLMSSEEFRHIHQRAPVILAGDFNDVWGTLGARVLAPAGFRTLRLQRTFPAYAPLRPIDGIHVRGSIEVLEMRASRLELARSASDHLPLVAELQVT